VRVEVPPERRARAFGMLGATLGAAAASGPALGGWIGPIFGWRWLFAMNLPVLAASWLLQPSTVAREPARGGPDRPVRPPFDWVGSMLIGAVLVLLTMATRAHGTAAYAMSAGGVVAGALLLVQERRVPAPVVDLHLFSRPVFVAGAGVIGLQNLAMYSLLIELPFLFGGTAGSRIGLAIVAMTATMAVTSPIGGWLAERLGTRPVVVAGGLAGAAGVFAIAQLGADAQPFDVGVRLLLVGLGLGLSTGPSQAAGLTAVAGEKSGRAAATMSTVRYLGSIAGTVVLGYSLAGGAGAASRQHVALWIFVGAFLMSAILGLMLPQLGGQDEPANLQLAIRN
jgi:MFS family permease